VPNRWVTLALLVLCGCADATGSVSGGGPLLSTPDAGGAGDTWTDLYADFFGPAGQASCTAQTGCHGLASESGAQISGFVCGNSKDACWSGMTIGIPADAGGIFPPIVTAGASDPTKTQLYQALHQPAASTSNTLCAAAGGNPGFACNMPCGNSTSCTAQGATYTFTSDDLARISAWIQQGAQDN
jgi:hypothetical protein